MKCITVTLFLLTIFSQQLLAECPDYLNSDIRLLHSDKMLNICQEFGNNPILIVNTASKCGFTPQFKELESLYQKFRDRGLVVLGFPSDSFKQEINNEEAVAEVCYINYGVTFPMFSTIEVRGRNAHPLFRALAAQSDEPSWNFNKYLLDKDGKVVQHFGSRAKPESAEFKQFIESAL